MKTLLGVIVMMLISTDMLFAQDTSSYRNTIMEMEKMELQIGARRPRDLGELFGVRRIQADGDPWSPGGGEFPRHLRQQVSVGGYAPHPPARRSGGGAQ